MLRLSHIAQREAASEHPIAARAQSNPSGQYQRAGMVLGLFNLERRSNHVNESDG